MFALDLSTVRDTVLSTVAAALLSTVLVAAAVVPAQTAVAATLGL